MSFQQHITVDNILKVVLAIAVGVLLYTIFFKKTEGYYNYRAIDEIVGPHAYPMDYENDYEDDVNDDSDIPYTEPTDEYVEEVVSDTGDMEDDIVDEVVLDQSADEELYQMNDDAEEAYDDSMDNETAETEIPDEIYEEADSETEQTAEGPIQPYQAYDFLYASDVEDGLQENFVMYENNVGVDTMYQ
ncbi:hypothetical protein ATCVGM07011_426R [Acanthocystis turfacea Chlorella virus GM0701.1]|nr:hypothetical protein ATCVGM07011_426R [Acanthocystis turfacea Chlorella virus GM0701.1]